LEEGVTYLKQIKKKSKRKPYVRSAYFKREKIFLDLFWVHLFEKARGDRLRRLKYFAAAIELIENSRQIPSTKEDVNNRGVLLHRFSEITKDKETFFIHIKESKVSVYKHLISIFPENLKKDSPLSCGV
jgi:hypothetical protein